jgi:hypothetical protein
MGEGIHIGQKSKGRDGSEEERECVVLEHVLRTSHLSPTPCFTSHNVVTNDGWMDDRRRNPNNHNLPSNNLRPTLRPPRLRSHLPPQQHGLPPGLPSRLAPRPTHRQTSPIQLPYHNPRMVVEPVAATAVGNLVNDFDLSEPHLTIFRYYLRLWS